MNPKMELVVNVPDYDLVNDHNIWICKMMNIR